MKKIILIPLFFLLGIALAFAQTTDNAPDNTWDLINYKGSAAVIIFNKDSARAQRDAKGINFKIKTDKQLVHLIDKRKDEQILKILGISKKEIEKRFPQNSALLPTEKLLTEANRFPDQKLLIGATHTISGDIDANSLSDSDQLQDQNFSDNIKPKEEKNRDWIYFIILDFIALGIGLWIGLSLKKKKDKRKKLLPSSIAQTEISPEEFKKLQSENLLFQQRMSHALNQIEEIKFQDNSYFEKAFENIILPLQESLEKGDTAKTLALLTIASAQLSSISRSKIGKKLKHDDANIQYLITQNKSNTAQFPEITSKTAIDKIPHNLQKLIQLLQENKVHGLDDTVVMGYKIKDLK